MAETKFPFIDASFAAELLGVQTADVLDLVQSGKLQTFGGKERNPFVRTADVERLAQELGREVSQPPVKRRAADNPVRRVELRLRHDTRWADISDTDIDAWVREQDSASRSAARRVAKTARERLAGVIQRLEGSDGG